MKANKHLRRLYLLSLLCVVVAAGVVHAREGDVYTLLDDASLRQGPDSFYAPTSRAAKGAQAIELHSSGEWKKVRLFSSGDVGWVYADSLASVSASASKVAESSVVVDKSEPQPIVIVNNQQPLPDNKPALPSQFESGQFGVPRSTEPAQANSMEVLVLKPKAALQNLGSAKKSVDGERVSPIFEDGAVSQESDSGLVAQHNRRAVESADQVNKVAAADENMHAPVADKTVLQQFPVQLVSRRAADMTRPEQIDDVKSTRVEDAPSVLSENSHEVVANNSEKPEADAIQKSNVPSDINRNVDVKPMPIASIKHHTEGMDRHEQPANPLGTSQMVMQTAVIRVGPSALSEVLGWAGAGAQVQTMHQQGKWMKVRLLDSGRIGWVEAVALDGSNTPVTAMLMAKQSAPDSQAPAQVKATDVSNVVNPDAMMQAQNKAKDTGPENRLMKATPQWEGTHDLGKPVAVEAVQVAPTEKTDENALKTEKSLYTFNKRATLRAGPNARFDSVYWAGKGSQATELDRKGAWIRIQMRVSKKIGWVYEQSLELVSAGVGVAAATVALATAVASSDEASIKYNLHSFNRKSTLRAGPGLKYDAVSWAGKGAYAIEQDRKGDWIRVQMQVNKRIGWVNQGSLKLVKVAVAMSGAIVSSADKPAKKQEESMDDSDHKLHFFKRTSNLRAGPGKEFERIAWGGRNEAAEQIEHKGDWKRVRMIISGKTGWVFNEFLVRAVHPGHIMGVTRSVLTSVVQRAEKSGQMYQVVRTVPLRADAGELADLIGSVQKGDLVAWLEERNGWVRVNPQIDGGKVGWLKVNLLRKREQFKVEHTQALINQGNALAYKDRISTGETFNFSYAALEEALYKIPVEDIHIRIRKDDLEAVFLKRQFDQSPFDIRLTTGRHKLHGTLKVLGSSTRIFKKKSILIKLDKESARWYGHRRMALRSMASDKALMREWMTWKMMAALGMKVPEVHFTRVSFNRGEKTALYLSIEWMGPEFLEGNGLDTHGEFYQPNDAAHCGDLYSPDKVELCFDKITPFGDFSNLKAMARAVNAATNENIHEVLANYFEDESIINWIAVNGLVTNGDTYNKNYWLYYHPTRKKWTLVPWDYNLTYGRTYDIYSTKKFRIFNDNFQYYYPPDVGAGNPIKDKALRNPILRKRLEDKIKHLIGMEPNGSEHTFGWFSPTVMHARIGNLASVVGKEVYKDTFLSYGEADFTKSYESLMHYVTAHDYFLKTKLFGDFPWNPEPPNQPYVFNPLPDALFGVGHIDAGAESLHLVDRGWGYFVAQLNLHEPLKTKAQFEVKIEGGSTPKYLPTVVQSASRCIERSWLLKTKSPNISATGDFMIEYAQENSRRSEVLPSIHEELLELWMLDGNRWKPIQTEVNEYSNTLTAKNVHVESDHEYRFVACSPF